MPKYINANQFERACMFDQNCEDMQDVIYKLRDYPAADVVEVVRCKDCKKHGILVDCPMEECFDGNLKDDDYCSYGERRKR